MHIHGISASQLLEAGKEFFDNIKEHSEVKVEKKALLELLRGKLEGAQTASEVEEPLEYTRRCKTSAVLVATSEIDINGLKVTKLASKVLAKQAGLSLDALSHCEFLLLYNHPEPSCTTPSANSSYTYTFMTLH